MSVKDFFIAVLKIIVLYIFIQGILAIVAQIVFLGEIDDTSYIFWLIGIILIFLAIIYFMFSRADMIVKFLQLEKGFSTERFDFSMTDSKYILEIAIVIIGLYMLVFTIPSILMDGYALLKSNINTNAFSLGEVQRSLQTNLVTNFLYILVGLVIIFLRKPIAHIFTTETDEA